MPELIPRAALDSHIGILGKTGSGKSNLAKVIAERLMQGGERVCAIDPTGTWWGLRLRQDGQKPSQLKPIIFGGEHADIPITEHHGAVVAEAIATSSDSAIIDTRHMSTGQRTRFFTAFAETLLRTNKGPLHLIIDEAHLFAPQGKVNSPQAGAMLAEANELVSRGRSAGLRVTLISQRPAKLHKDSLTQVETLIAMRLIAPQDRRAVEDWVGEWADPVKGKEIIGSLPSLPVGDAWVWAPQLEHLQRTHFPLAATFDSGKPLSRDQAAPSLAPLDVAAVGEKMDAIRQEAMANDPARLKRRITELEKELARPIELRVNPEVIEAAEQRGYGAGRDAGVQDERKRLGKLVIDFAADFAIGPEISGDTSGTVVSAGAAIGRKPKPAYSPSGGGELKTLTPAMPSYSHSVRPDDVAAQRRRNVGRRSELDAMASGFTGPQLKILRALAMWRSLGKDAPTKPMVATIAGYSHSSGGFGNLLGSLRGLGAIDYPSPGTISLLADVDEPITVEEGFAALLGKLTNPQRKLVDALRHGEMSKSDLGIATGYSSTSGGFGNLLGSLRTLGLVTYPQPGRVALEGWVFDLL